MTTIAETVVPAPESAGPAFVPGEYLPVAADAVAEARRGGPMSGLDHPPALPLRRIFHIGTETYMALPELAWAVDGAETVRDATAAENAMWEARRAGPDWNWLFGGWGQSELGPLPGSAEQDLRLIETWHAHAVSATFDPDPYDGDYDDPALDELDKGRTESLGRFYLAHESLPADDSAFPPTGERAWKHAKRRRGLLRRGVRGALADDDTADDR